MAATGYIPLTVNWYTGKLANGNECVVCEVNGIMQAVSIEPDTLPTALVLIEEWDVTDLQRVRSVRLIPENGVVTLYIDEKPYRKWYA